MSTPVETERKLSFVQKLCFAFGHVQNDLSAAMWFSYFLMFLHYVKNFEHSFAGYLLLTGQLIDAVCTPFIGYELDNWKSISKLGKRKSCHLLGTICVALSIPFIFSECLGCSNQESDWTQCIYYAPIIAIFQFGWAAVQIAHLSFIPYLTSNEYERVELNGLRNAFTVLSNITVFGVAWMIFRHHSDSDDTRTSFTTFEFQKIVFIIIGIGIVCNVIFYIGVKEKKEIEEYSLLTTREAKQSYYHKKQLSEKTNMKWKDWFRNKQFYKIAVIYVCTRMFVNISQIYLPLYTIESLLMEEVYVAVLPLVAFATGFVSSLLMKTVHRQIGKKTTFIIGEICGVIACVWFYLIPSNNSNQVYATCVLFGVSASTMIVTSLAMASDLIADNADSGGFVYGVMSFADKLINGLTIALIQGLNRCTMCSDFFRSIVSFVPGSAVIVGFVVFLILRQKNVVRKQINIAAIETTQDLIQDMCEEERLLIPKCESHDVIQNGTLTKGIRTHQTNAQ